MERDHVTRHVPTKRQEPIQHEWKHKETCGARATEARAELAAAMVALCTSVGSNCDMGVGTRSFACWSQVSMQTIAMAKEEGIQLSYPSKIHSKEILRDKCNPEGLACCIKLLPV